MTISGSSGSFHSDRGRVSAEKVEDLLAALNAPLIDKPSLQECGADTAWLEAHYATALQDFTHRKLREFSAEQIEYFKHQFTAAAIAQATFEQTYVPIVLDDEPEVSVTVDDGPHHYGVRSTSPHPFLLPWSGTDSTRGGYSCRIGRAIAALMPKSIPNRSRLVLGRGFAWDMAETTMLLHGDEWNRLDTEHLVGREVDPVFARYKPRKTAISDLASIDTGGNAWNARLSDPSGPPNLEYTISLNYWKPPLAGVDKLMHDLPVYKDLVLSVPWLRQFIESHPETSFGLHYVNGRSLSPKAQKDLAEELLSHGMAELARRIEGDAQQIAFLDAGYPAPRYECWSRFLVLPSREVLLWHFQCDSTLGFPASSFKTWDCLGWRCAGALISPDGQMEP